MTARFYVDEDDLALGRALGHHRDGVIYPGHPDLPAVPRGTLDDEWLRIVGTDHLVVITRDRRIRYRPVERRAWVTNRVRGVVLTGRMSQSTADSLALLESRWPELECLAEQVPEGPWMYALTRAGFRRIELA